jgi:hypothetical protein
VGLSWKRREENIMSNIPSPNNPPVTSGDIYERLAAQRQNVAYGFIVVGLALAAIPISNVALYRWQSLAFFLWGAALSLLVIGAGIWTLMAESAGTLRDQADRLRVAVLIVLGGAGLLTALLGLMLPFSSPPFSVTNYPDIFEGGVRKWRERENAWAVTRLVGALLGGLVLMFVGLMQARTFERTSPNLRRLLYGYNAILTSVLLILIVGLINLLPYSGVRPFSYANEATDWTRTGIHSLHPATKNVLAELKEPVKAYVLGSTNDQVIFETNALLEKCRAIAPQLSWEQLSPFRNRSDVQELMKEYQLPDPEGVLLVYGTKPNTVHDFIKRSDLFEQKFSGEASRQFAFKGENALLNSLTFLSSGKKKAVVYFTQGNGEMDFNGRQSDERGLDGGMGILIDELNRINYDCHDLTVTANTDKIPEDADIVVIARPREEYPAKFVTALRDYLNGTNRKDNKKGKLFVLFDVVQRGGKGPIIRTGLEALAAEHGVRLGDNRVLDVSNRQEPLLFTTIANTRSTNPIARSFTSEEGSLLFYLYKARTVEPSQPANPPGAPPAPNPAETLLTTLPNQLLIVETDLDTAPRALITDLMRAGPQKISEKLSRSPISCAVTVAEGKTQAPFPGHEFEAKEGQPRMVVFGDASWISNPLLQQFAPNHFNLFSSCLSWLAGRSDIGTRVPPTQHDLYRIKAAPGSGWRLMLLPGALMILGVLGLGVGVWVVRRR